MMDIFVFDTSDLTDALFEARLNNMLSRRYYLENFVKSLEANPKQFPDFGPRLAEIKAQTLICLAQRPLCADGCGAASTVRHCWF